VSDDGAGVIYRISAVK